MNPLVSIIVPVFNVEKYLEECLDSILNQTYENIEVILVDDGSTDSSGKICDRYLKEDTRIKVFHKINQGVSITRNFGVEKSNGEYITFVDSDDFLPKLSIEILVKEIEKEKADILVCAMKRDKVKENLNYNKIIFNREEALIELFKGNLYRFSLWAKIYKASIVKKYKFPEGKIHEDQATTYKYFLEANKIVYIDYVGYIYYRRENSILTKKYNIKRLDSFYNWQEIVENLKNENFNIKKQMYLRYLWWIFDNLNYIAFINDSKDTKFKYMKIIKESLKGNRLKLFWYNKYQLKYVILYLIFLINVKFFYKIKGVR